MINPQELRIGNWVKIRGQYYVQVMDLIGLRWFSYMQGQGCDYEDAEPIPLTPTILEKLGGKAFGDGDYIFEIEKCGIIIWANDGSIAIGDKSDSLLFATDAVCKYVHEWQNLIYSLTKKELQIDSII